MAQKNPLLNLSTSVETERDFILIDEEQCFIRSKEDLNIKDYVGLRKMGKRIAALYNSEDVTEDDLEEFAETMKGLLGVIFINTSEETLNKLSDAQQMEIIGAFTKLLTAGLSEGVQKEAKTEAEKMRKTARANRKATPKKVSLAS